MGANEFADHFTRHREHLRGVALRMLGAGDQADDAVQETWLRACRVDMGAITNPRGWLTTVLARVCLDALRGRERRREDPTDLDAVAVVDHAIGDPEDDAMTADAVGLALFVVLDRLGPYERVAFVLHDLFGVPFDEIAALLDRSPVAAKKLASRARARVYGSAPPDPALSGRRAVAEAFLAAARTGDVDALLAVLAPEVIRRADAVARPADAPAELRGARHVADETRTNAARARDARVMRVDGDVGIVVAPRGRLAVVLRLTIDGERIVAIDVIAAPAELRRLRLELLDDV